MISLSLALAIYHQPFNDLFCDQRVYAGDIKIEDISVLKDLELGRLST